ncbi:hypothetical protein DAPPUDRAFT_69492, partial [Daphnia pulex]
EFLKSIDFHAPGDEDIKWFLKIYPNGQELEGSVSLLIYMTSPLPFKDVCINFVKFELVDQDTNLKLCTMGKEGPFNFPEANSAWGCKNIPQNRFLSLGNLRVICKLEYQVEKLEALKMPFSITSETEDLATNLAELYTSMNNSDVIFAVGNKEFPAHKAIVGARSPVFTAMFQHDMTEAALNRVEIVDIEPEIFQAVLRFIYTDQVNLTNENSTALLAASNRYFLNLLKWKCEMFLAQDLSVNNCCERLMLADTHDASNLKKVAGNVIRKSSAALKKTESWKKMMKTASPDLLREIIESVLLS